MMIIPERAVQWIGRWSDHGLSLGKHDGEGNPVFEYEPGDTVAADMVQELHDDGILLHGVMILLIEMLKRASAEGGFDS